MSFVDEPLNLIPAWFLLQFLTWVLALTSLSDEPWPGSINWNKNLPSSKLLWFPAFITATERKRSRRPVPMGIACSLITEDGSSTKLKYVRGIPFCHCRVHDLRCIYLCTVSVNPGLSDSQMCPCMSTHYWRLLGNPFPSEALCGCVSMPPSLRGLSWYFLATSHLPCVWRCRLFSPYPLLGFLKML